MEKQPELNIFPETNPEINPEVFARVLGGYAMTGEYIVPTDPMDDLQCESCQ